MCKLCHMAVYTLGLRSHKEPLFLRVITDYELTDYELATVRASPD